MHRESRTLFLAVSFLFCTSGSVWASSAYFGTLEEPVSSRVMGMGSAGTALEAGGFAFYNPALISLRPVSYISLEFSKLAADLGRGFIETGWIFPGWFAGGAFQSQSIEFPYSDEHGIIDAYGSEQNTMGSLAAGFRKGNFALGVAVNGLHNRIAQYAIYGWSLSGGAVYSLIPGKLNLGVSYLHGYGQNTHFLDTANTFFREQLPSTGRGGVAWTDSFSGKLPYTVSADLVYSSNYETLMVPLGVEVWLLPSLAIRVGKRVNFETDLFTVGVGVKWENMKFDAAFIPTRLVSDVSLKWSMGLTYELPSFSGKDQAAPETALPQDKSAQTKQIQPVKQDADTVFTRDTVVEQNDPVLSTDSIAVDTSGAGFLPEEQASDTIALPDSLIVDTLETMSLPEEMASDSIVTQDSIGVAKSSEEVNSAISKTPSNERMQIDTSQAGVNSIQEKNALEADSTFIKKSGN